MSKTSVWVLIVLVAVVIVSAVLFINRPSAPSSSTSGTSGAVQPTPTTAPAVAPTLAAPSAASVSIQGFQFSPASLSVKKGTTVTWTNKDSVPHTVTADSGSGPGSGTLNQGSTYSYTFNTAGTFGYHCSIHPSMHGTVTVTR